MMASANISRRGFFGHAAGAYSAIAITGGTAVTVSYVSAVIARHRALWDALDPVIEAIDFPSRARPADAEARLERYRVVREAEEGALKELLSYRPTTMDECAERLRYLRSTVWDGCQPEEWEWEMLLDSMSA